MSQTPLFVALHCIGVLACLAFGPRARILLCSALGFSIGLASMVALMLLVLALGIPYTSLSAAAGAVALVGCSLVVLARRGWPSRAEWKVVGAWTAGFVALCLPLTHVNLSFLTYDSHTMVMLGGAVFDDHSFAPGMLERLSGYGVFQVVAQSGAGFTRQTYLYGLAPVLGLSTIALFAVTLRCGLDALGARIQRRGVLIALVTAATFTVYMLQSHMFYIHTNLGSAVYLFVFVSLFWLSEIEGEASAIPIAFVALLALGLHRIENPVVGTLFMSLTVLQSRLPARRLLPSLWGYTLLVCGWLWFLSADLPPVSQFLTPTKCYAVIALALAFSVYATLSLWRRPRLLEWFNRWVPETIAIVMALAFVAAFATRPAYMEEQSLIWFHNLWDSSYWEGCWAAVVALAIVGSFAPGPPARQVFVYGIPVYFALTLLLVYGRTTFRLAIDDSAVRMIIHLVPSTFFYFGVKFIPLLATPTPEPEPTLPSIATR